MRKIAYWPPWAEIVPFENEDVITEKSTGSSSPNKHGHKRFARDWVEAFSNNLFGLNDQPQYNEGETFSAGEKDSFLGAGDDTDGWG